MKLALIALALLASFWAAASTSRGHVASPFASPASDSALPAAEAVDRNWWIAFNTVMAEHPGQGAWEKNVVYHWAGPLPLDIPIVPHTLSDGSIYETLDPVAYALLRCDRRWIEVARLGAAVARHSGTPGVCTATLKKGAGQTHFSFSCAQECGSYISCEPSNPQRNEGYCSCAGGAEPEYCHGTFTRSDPSTWNITCSQSECPVGQSCSFDYAIIEEIETWWCDCK